MASPPAIDWMPVENYLASEATSPVRREYVAGRVYAMAGASLRHNQLAGNLFALLHDRPRGRGCQVFFADVKLHIADRGRELFYYPNLMVCCDPGESHSHYRERPCLLVEVLSESTRDIDTREKLIAYTGIESLRAYLLIEQDRVAATLQRRESGWKPERHEGPDARLSIPCGGGVELTLAELHAGLEANPTDPA